MTPPRPLVPSDAARLAYIHSNAFDTGWSETAFMELLGLPTTLALGASDATGLQAFVIATLAADEADILTIATAPPYRRAGLAKALMEALIGHARARGANRITLDVAADNLAARRLYGPLGFVEDGRRPGYYPRADSAAIDALLLSLELAPDAGLQSSPTA